MRSALPIAVRTGWDAEAWAVAQVETASAPALVARGDGTLLAANAFADFLVEPQGLVPSLKALVADTLRADKTQVARVVLQDKDAGGQIRQFDLTLMPLPGGTVLAVAREATLEANLVGALSASRALFRDLALCASDFAFETDAAGYFTWVSPRGALGFSAAELHGSHPCAVFGACEGIEKFSAQQTVQGDEICCVAKSGDESRIVLTVMPVIGADGHVRGTRGSARDVTGLRQHERNAEIGRRREALIGAIVAAVRGQIEPRRMMLAAADALLSATESQGVTIKPSRIEASARIGAAAAGARHEISATTSYQGRTNGTLVVTRNGEGPAYGAEEQALIEAVVPHLGIAIALVESLSMTAVQSRTDAMTGLLSQPSFAGEAARRLGALARAGRSSALVMFDCEEIDSGVPRAARDNLMWAVGQIVTEHVESGCLAARCANDAFAFLLEGASEESAAAKARNICSDVAVLRRLLGLGAGKMPSFGVAFAEAEAGEPLEELLVRAGRALAAANPLKKVMSC